MGAGHSHDDDAPHGHGARGDHGSPGKGHGHTHGYVDPSITSSDRGLWATKWSFVGLLVTASIQLAVVFVSGSVALLSDTIHNFGDAATGIPLGIAFLFAKRRPTARFTYGFGRVEDLAGIAVVATIFFSAVVAFYQSIDRLLHPQVISHLWAVAGASIVGFLGNEGVAVFRLRVGKEIGSAALIADGYHARTDGWTSLAVLVGAIGVYYGYPKADPIVGLVITAAILVIVWQSVKTVFIRVLDGVEPDVNEQVRHAAAHVAGVIGVTDVRSRWIGHQLHSEVNITVPSALSVAAAHDISKAVEREIKAHLPFMAIIVIHVDPAEEAGERFHTGLDHGAAAAAHDHGTHEGH